MTAPKTRLSFWRIIPLAVFIVLAGMLLYRIENPRVTGSVDSPLIGRPLPDIGMAVKGPAIVNFFASWCAPCKVEHPYLLIAKSRGIKIVGVAYKDKQTNIAAYLQRGGNPYVNVIYDDDGKKAIDLGITGVPESFLVDEKGIVRRRLQGPFASVPDILQFAVLP